MIYKIFPRYDTVLYEGVSTQNAGIDQILEINKVSDDDNIPENTRALIKFDLTDISESISDGTISGSNLSSAFIYFFTSFQNININRFFFKI